MAKVRDLKKDIDFVVNELVIECFTYNLIFPEKNNEEIAKIIADVIQFGGNLLKKVNGVKSSIEKPAKKQFSTIRKEFNSSVEEFVARLEKLEKE